MSNNNQLPAGRTVMTKSLIGTAFVLIKWGLLSVGAKPVTINTYLRVCTEYVLHFSNLNLLLCSPCDNYYIYLTDLGFWTDILSYFLHMLKSWKLSISRMLKYRKIKRMAKILKCCFENIYIKSSLLSLQISTHFLFRTFQTFRK